MPRVDPYMPTSHHHYHQGQYEMETCLVNKKDISKVLDNKDGLKDDKSAKFGSELVAKYVLVCPKKLL